MNEKTFLIPLTEEEMKNFLKCTFEEVINDQKTNRQSKELLTFKDVIALLDISPSTLNNWKREGKLPYHKLNGRIYFKYDEIVQSLNDAGNTKARRLQEGSLYGSIN